MKIEKLLVQILICAFFLCAMATFGQEKNRVDQVRKMHYAPEGNSFVLKNGTRKFNRTLYKTNTGFRGVTGGLPEFALYMPKMGETFKLRIQKRENSKWITEDKTIDTRYTLGIMHYKIQDPILGNGELLLKVIAVKNTEGFALKVTGNNIPKDVSMIWALGGASDKKFSRDGNIGTDRESVFYLQPSYFINNKYALQKNSFLLEYGSETNKQKTGNNRSLTGFHPKSEIHLANATEQNLPLELYRSPNSLTVTNGKINSIPKSGLFWMLETKTKILKFLAYRTRLFHGWFGFYDRCHKTNKSVLEIRNHFENFRRFQTHKRIQQLWCRLCCSNNLRFALEQKKTLKNIALKPLLMMC